MISLLRIVWLAVAVAALATACTTSPTPPSSAVPAATEQVAASDCGPLDLRTPSGTQIDLTGTWRAVEAVHYVRQVGNCVWWVALSDVPGQVLAERAMLMFRGELRMDFTLRGEWMSVLRPPFAFNAPPSGPATFSVDVSEVDGVDGVETIRLRSANPADETGPYGSATLIYEGPLPPTR